MEQNDSTNVLTAFEMLLEEVENEIEFVNNAGAKAFAERNYERGQSLKFAVMRLNCPLNQPDVFSCQRGWESVTNRMTHRQDGAPLHIANNAIRHMLITTLALWNLATWKLLPNDL